MEIWGPFVSIASPSLSGWLSFSPGWSPPQNLWEEDRGMHVVLLQFHPPLSLIQPGPVLWHLFSLGSVIPWETLSITSPMSTGGSPLQITTGAGRWPKWGKGRCIHIKGFLTSHFSLRKTLFLTHEVLPAWLSIQRSSTSVMMNCNHSSTTALGNNRGQRQQHAPLPYMGSWGMLECIPNIFRFF